MTKLTFFERESGNVTTLDLNGDIIFGEGSVEFRKAIRRLISEGKKKIHLNLRSVGYVDSSGIGELISSLTAINREGGELTLLNPSARLKELLTVCKLLSIFEICEEEKLIVSYK